MAKEELPQELPRTRRRKVKEPMVTETILGVLAVLCLMLAVLLLFSAVHAGGRGGEVLFGGIYSLIGVYSYFTPLIFLYAAYYLWKEEIPEIRILTFVGGLFLVLGVGGLGTVFFGVSFGGWLGSVISSPLVANFSTLPSVFILAGLSAIGTIIFMERKPSLDPAFSFGFSIIENITSYISGRKNKNIEPSQEKNIIPETEELSNEDELSSIDTETISQQTIDEDEDLRKELFGELSIDEEEVTPKPKKEKEVKQKPVILTPEFVPPPLDLLNADSGKSGAGDSKSKMTTIQRTLAEFRINVEMSEVTVGPTVTQFTLKPAQGVNLSKIVALHDNLAMELGAEFLRIEAPIPGKTLVGIEIPNERKATLGLRCLNLKAFKIADLLT
jgi:S-DNA-T family DNA segregation ATPase FtsK/SpoIIIE